MVAVQLNVFEVSFEVDVATVVVGFLLRNRRVAAGTFHPGAHSIDARRVVDVVGDEIAWDFRCEYKRSLTNVKELASRILASLLDRLDDTEETLSFSVLVALLVLLLPRCPEGLEEIEKILLAIQLLDPTLMSHSSHVR